MTGSRRFSLSSPDWGQAHLTLDAIVAYVDDELSAGAHARAEAHLRCCGECRTEVVAQRQARAALRDAGGPCLPSNLLRSLRSIPVETELPPHAARSGGHGGRAVRPPARRVSRPGSRSLRPPPSRVGAASSRCAPGRPRLRPVRPSVLPQGPVRRGLGHRAECADRRGAGHAERHAGAHPAEPRPRRRRARPARAPRPRRRAVVPTGPTLAAPARLHVRRTRPCPRSSTPSCGTA